MAIPCWARQQPEDDPGGIVALQSADVTAQVVDGPAVKVRCVIEPNEPQAAFFDRLGIELPRRIAIPIALQEGAIWR